nr:hypothetical protein [Corynebacterium ulcerans]
MLIRDVHYIVRDGKVALIDASKGRIAELQRWTHRRGDYWY